MRSARPDSHALPDADCLVTALLNPQSYCIAGLQVLLLEAYEQLERDVGLEVDKALALQRDEQARLQRRVAFLEQQLEAERAHSAVTTQAQVRRGDPMR